MDFKRAAIEKESPEEVGAVIKYNLSESAVSDRTLQHFSITIPNDIVLTYSEHQGSHKIRHAVAEDLGLSPNDILVTTGASSALFIIATSLLSRGDHFVTTRPNYATNIDTPRAIGCDISIIDLKFEDRFTVSVDELAAQLRPNTKLISLCSPNNPTGTMIPAADMESVARLAAEHGCYLLVDETYASLAEAGMHKPAASLGEHVIGVSSMSKAYGLPGIRIGWLSSRNAALHEKFLAAKEQINITGSVLDEFVAGEVLLQRVRILEKTMVEIQERRRQVKEWVQSDEMLDWVEPHAGVMCFILVTKEPVGGINAFYNRLLRQHGTYVGPGRWFERPDTFFRLGYGWPTRENLTLGLAAISKALRG